MGSLQTVHAINFHGIGLNHPSPFRNKSTKPHVQMLKCVLMRFWLNYMKTHTHNTFDTSRRCCCSGCQLLLLARQSFTNGWNESFFLKCTGKTIFQIRSNKNFGIKKSMTEACGPRWALVDNYIQLKLDTDTFPKFQIHMWNFYGASNQ